MKSSFFFVFFIFGIVRLYAQAPLGSPLKPQCPGDPPPVYGITNDGRDFYLGMLSPSFNSVMNSSLKQYSKVYAFATTYYDNQISVSYFLDDGSETPSVTYQLPAKQSVKILLDASAMQMNADEEKPAYRSCHIVAKQPVTIQYMSLGACGGGSYLALPVIGLGKKYVAASYNDNPGNGALLGSGADIAENSAGEFEIIATEDETEVMITPMATTIGGHIGMHSGNGANNISHPYQISLKRGQCYLVKSDGSDESSDISGSVIESTKPIAVISGHENANLGGTGDYSLEARDFMIEQMVPVELWDSTGFVAIPIKEGTPTADAGHGDNYRIYSYDSAPVHIRTINENLGVVDFIGKRFNDPIPELFDETGVTKISTTDGKKISVMQYDQRSQPDNPPFSAPSMMTIVPQSRWKTSYYLYVPGNEPFEKYQDYYINVFSNLFYGPATGDISYTLNGGEIKTLSTLQRAGGFNSIGAAQYKLYPGSYHFFARNTFMVYSYGMRGVSANGALSASEGDYFFEYAAPAGMALYTGLKAPVGIAVEELCNAWNIHLLDSAGKGGQIKEIFLLNDPEGVYTRQWNNALKAKSENVTLDRKYANSGDDHFNPKSYFHKDLSGRDTFSFYIDITNANIPATAYVEIVDDGGNITILTLQHTVIGSKIISQPSFVNNTPVVIFPPTRVGETICTTFVLKNPDYYSASIEIKSLRMSSSTNNYTLTPLTSLPKYLYYYGDSFTMTLCYSPTDSVDHIDTLIIKTECYDVAITIITKASKVIKEKPGAIYAGDVNFGTITKGLTGSKLVVIRNNSKTDLTIIDYELPNDNFSLDDASIRRLPVTIAPNQFATMNIVYHPKNAGDDTTRIIWNTDSPNPEDGKNYSLLSGRGVMSSDIAQMPEEHSILIYPNPTSGKSIHILFPPSHKEMTLRISDILGREVCQRNIAAENSEIEIPTQDLMKGSYYVTIGNRVQLFVKD
jgi:hypothetical protein